MIFKQIATYLISVLDEVGGEDQERRLKETKQCWPRKRNLFCKSQGRGQKQMSREGLKKSLLNLNEKRNESQARNRIRFS